VSVHDALQRARALEQPAFISLLPGEALAALVEGAPDGPLAGVPFAVKDNLDVAGLPTTAACPARIAPAATSAAAVTLLVQAGAVPIGKTNMDQFATGLVGTRSPYGACHAIASAAHVSGGSSSGSAVAVAAGVVPLALGTDTAGSGRVPAAFNGIVGVKPSRGLVSTYGLLPACPSLDCVTTLTRDVATARIAFDVLVSPDPRDPWSRTAPAARPARVAARMRVIGVPDELPGLDDEHAAAWKEAVEHAARVATVVSVDVTAFVEAATLLYDGAFVAERLASFGSMLEPDGPHLDAVVRRIVTSASRLTAAQAFADLQRLQRLRAVVEPVWDRIDALLLPVTPGHPTLAEVRADPVGVNARLGTFTNMANLLDLCAVAVPAGTRPDGLPFGVQLLAPAFADDPLLDLAARWCGEAVPAAALPAGSGRGFLAVAGAHLTGQPLNAQLLGCGGRLHERARTAGGYRMYDVPGPLPRPGIIDAGDGPAAGLEVEIWDLPHTGVTEVLASLSPPLALGPVRMAGGAVIPGFLAAAGPLLDGAADITAYGGWRAYLAARC
jgi:allophanate hydrolase